LIFIHRYNFNVFSFDLLAAEAVLSTFRCHFDESNILKKIRLLKIAEWDLLMDIN